jgi:hypothetical protein
VVDLIAAMTTRQGLKVRAQLDQGYYPRQKKVTDKQLASISLARHDSQASGTDYTLIGRST